MEFRLRNRARLRRKETSDLATRLRDALGTTEIFGEEAPIEVGEGPDRRFLILGSDLIGFYEKDQPFLTPRGLLKFPAQKRYVTVDMGAVRFVTNGADVMGPGITDAHADVRPEDLVWIREERHGKPLAVGVALAEASVLRSKAKGKQVRTLFYVGDKVWAWGQEDEVPEPPTETAAEPE